MSVSGALFHRIMEIFLHLSFSSFSLTFPWFDNDHLILRPVKSDVEL